MNHKEAGKIILYTRKIETKLEKLGAEGRGLHEKISSIEDYFPKETIKQLRWIATIRNNSMHDYNFKLNDINDFKSTCKTVIKKLGKKDYKATYNTKNTQNKTYVKKLSSISPSSNKSSTTPQKYNGDNNTWVISVLFIAIFTVAIWWFFSGDSKDEIRLKINLNQQVIKDLNKKINTINADVRKIGYKIRKEKKNQGALRNIFNDTEEIDNLESKKEEFEEKKELLLQKLESKQNELEELLNKKHSP